MSQALQLGTSKAPLLYPHGVKLTLSLPAFIGPGSVANKIYLSGFSALQLEC